MSTDNTQTVHQYATWNGVTGTNGGTQYLALGQAFWVRASGASPVLTASETVKTATQTTYFRVAAPENLLRITMKLGNVRDEAVVHFREDATNGFDAHADALKLPNTTFNLSTIANTSSLAINSLALQGCSGSIKINITNAAAGSYTLNFSDYESFANTTAITMTDNLTATTIDVLTTSTYNFTVTAVPNTFGSGRFVLNFASKKYDATATGGIVCTEGTATAHSVGRTGQWSLQLVRIARQPGSIDWKHGCLHDASDLTIYRVLRCSG